MNHLVQLKEALRSGEYEQTIGQLFDGNGYCCLGLAEHVCLGVEFEKRHGGGAWRDECGKADVLADFVAYQLNLGQEVTEEELRKARIMAGGDESIVNGLVQRQSILALANDAGKSFEEIADLIEELGWDKEETWKQ